VQVFGLAISFIVIAILLGVFLIAIRKDEKNVRYAVSIVYPKDTDVPTSIIQKELVKMLERGLIILVVTFVILMVFFNLFTTTGAAIIAHVILIVPIIINALVFRGKMNRLDQEYKPE
jgi:hypothetical protein